MRSLFLARCFRPAWLPLAQALIGAALLPACMELPPISRGVAPAASSSQPPADVALAVEGLTNPTLTTYFAAGDGGIAHVSYWDIKVGSPAYQALPPAEQSKLRKLQSSVLHSRRVHMAGATPGAEVTGTLLVSEGVTFRKQEVVLKIPANWNGHLVVAGTPGTRNELASDAVFAAWLVRGGYAYVAGNKGMTNEGVDGNATLLTERHPTQHWGMMMLDLAEWAQARLSAATGRPPAQIYAVGISNGGYQVRRALEIDHQRVRGGAPRLFAGGLDWEGAYFPDARVLDKDQDGRVSPAEYAAATHLVSSNERAMLAMGYAYAPSTATTPAEFAENPPYPTAQAAMQAAGFDPASAYIWGAYNTAFDAVKAALPDWRGIGYYNFTAFYFRAELLGHGAAAAAVYTPFARTGIPPYYSYLSTAPDAGWTEESVGWALKNANTGEFSAPLISIHGDRDGLLGLPAHGRAYADAVARFGDPSRHRLYVVENGGHIDAHSDGGLDFNFDGQVGEEGMADRFTYLQPYAERAFAYLVDWVQNGTSPPTSGTLHSDPQSDVLSGQGLSFQPSP